MSDDLRRRAEQGDSKAMTELGVDLIMEGDSQKAVEWWERAAALSNAVAMRNLGLYNSENGSFEEAVHWCQKAFNHGDSGGALQLGVLFHSIGDLSQAIYWWEQCANEELNAARNLVQMLDGPGDRERFLKWLEVLAYTHKDPWGAAILGTLLCGVEHKLWKEAGFSPLPLEEREKGLALIKLVEQGDEEDFQYLDYGDFAEAFYKRPGRPSGEGCSIEELELAEEYTQRAIDMLVPIAKHDPMASQAEKLYREQLRVLSVYIAARRKIGELAGNVKAPILTNIDDDKLKSHTNELEIPTMFADRTFLDEKAKLQKRENEISAQIVKLEKELQQMEQRKRAEKAAKEEEERYLGGLRASVSKLINLCTEYKSVGQGSLTSTTDKWMRDAQSQLAEIERAFRMASGEDKLKVVPTIKEMETVMKDTCNNVEQAIESAKERQRIEELQRSFRRY